MNRYPTSPEPRTYAAHVNLLHRGTLESTNQTEKLGLDEIESWLLNEAACESVADLIDTPIQELGQFELSGLANPVKVYTPVTENK